ncbi:MAG: hypothetical protein HOY79_22255 [Streptomyces sp.]|nr:hypothetical protein [Streptomyces sp.]
MTAIEWLEHDYDDLFTLGQPIIDTATAHMGLKLTSYAPDPAEDRPGPLFSIKRDDFSDEPRWPDAAWWPTPHDADALDNPAKWGRP